MPDSSPSPEEFGVGCRFSLYPMTDGFVDVILGALAGADRSGLRVETDDVSTCLSGPEPALIRYVGDVLVGAAARTGHVVASVLLSRGCPGEITCELGPDDGPVRAAELPEPTPAGITAAAHWSVYPLGVSDHMPLIAAAIDEAKRRGTFVRGDHYASRLEGDVRSVLTTVAAGWLAAGELARHVVSHATVSVGSPSERR